MHTASPQVINLWRVRGSSCKQLLLLLVEGVLPPLLRAVPVPPLPPPLQLGLDLEGHLDAVAPPLPPPPETLPPPLPAIAPPLPPRPTV